LDSHPAHHRNYFIAFSTILLVARCHGESLVGVTGKREQGNDEAVAKYRYGRSLYRSFRGRLPVGTNIKIVSADLSLWQ
jgi:hypothetical protein